MPLAASTPTDRVEQLIILTERLTGLIERETNLLKERRPNEIADFQDERSKLSNLYAQEMELIKHNASLIEGAPTNLKQELKDLTGTFHSRLDEHKAYLTRIRSVTEGMVRAVADEISKKNKADAGYGKDGKVHTAERPAAASIAVHEVI